MGPRGFWEVKASRFHDISPLLLLLLLLLLIIPNSHNLHITTEKLQKYTDLKEQLTRIWQLKNDLYNITSTIHEGNYPEQIT
jgi:hypothetical protein